jgi:hypothetical protein
MKITSWMLNSPEKKAGLTSAFILSPYLSFRSLNYHPSPSSTVVIRLVIFSFLTAFAVVLANYYLGDLSHLEIILISPTIYFFTEAMGAIGQAIFFKHPSFPIHRSPLKAISLGNFWGRDWNLWVQDWLRDVTQFIPRRGNKRLLAIFLISGIFHELMCNLPYWIMYRKSYFGTMLAYFLIQAMALWIDKKYIRHCSHLWRRVYLWAAVILPSPLFLNAPVLTFLGLRHE